jgi:acetyltransferase-like isoleucine patch superfamily enzyme
MIGRLWTRGWMGLAGHGVLGRTAMRLAALGAPPHKSRVDLARLSRYGYVAGSATLHHEALALGRHVFVDERVVIYQRPSGGRVRIGDGTAIYRDAILETAEGALLELGERVSIHPRCQINAYLGDIRIGDEAMLAPACALYSYDHGVAPGIPIKRQPLTSKGPIVIGRGAWLGYGTIVLGGVRVGDGAVIGAGSVVTHDIPDNAIANGVPARVRRIR